MDELSPISAFLNPLRNVRINCAAASVEQKPARVIRASEFGSMNYYVMCGVCGILSCGTAHTMVVPLDVVKCRLQVDSVKYQNMYHGFKVTVAEEGARGLAKGWAPTFLGYSAQGFLKFGLYELFKAKYTQLFGEDTAYLHRTSLYLAASASAEFFAVMPLAPFEAVKIKMQTKPDYANTLHAACSRMYAEEGFTAFYKGLMPLWMRQIPYTMMKFASFEHTVELLYKHVVPKPHADCSKREQLMVTFAAGHIAGVLCILVSHPADVVVTKLNQSKGSYLGNIVRNLRFTGLWQGLKPRIIMIDVLTALQWIIYDGVKVALAIPRHPPPVMPASLKAKLEMVGKETKMSNT